MHHSHSNLEILGLRQLCKLLISGADSFGEAQVCYPNIAMKKAGIIAKTLTEMKPVPLEP
jgi:hypothetical protein